MSKALSLDLRVRVLASVAQGLTRHQADERFGVSASSVSRWRRREQDQGDVRPKALGGDRRSGRIEGHKKTIPAVLEATPDLAIEELRRNWSEKGLIFGDGTIRRFFVRHAITRKKDRARERTGSSRHSEASGDVVRRSTRSRPRTSRLHRRHLGFHQHGAPPWPLPAGRKAAGWCAARPLEDHHLRRRAHDGRDDRSVVLDGPINCDAFEIYVQKVLVSELSPGVIVVIDNLSSHKGPQVREMIEAAGASPLYLPPYSRTSTRSRAPSPS
jgi:transposase